MKNECLLIRNVPKEPPRTKVAALDLDGTLLVWRIAGWPSRYEHYELWNSTVIPKLQRLYDQDGYKLVIFSNQGAIRGAFSGKKATFVKSLIEWLASTLQRPLHVVMSTNSKIGYHKPSPGMWSICEEECNRGLQFDIANSWYVGDSVGIDDPQGGVDERFAQNVGTARGQLLAFFEPQAYFGPSHAELRQKSTCTLHEYEPPPPSSLDERVALTGGYLQGPILLLLVGVQGSGKSTFCAELADDPDSKQRWVHLSQDTISQGKPGKRHQVEEATRQALREGKSVVVDRTHLTEEQRSYFIEIGKDINVKIHAVLLQPPKNVIEKRVRERVNHPGGVEGDKGVRIALASLMNIVIPTYHEGFDLINSAGTDAAIVRLSTLYRLVSKSGADKSLRLPSSFSLSNGTAIPSITLGTMGIGKRKAQEVVAKATHLGWKAVDTAPTYKNEVEVGRGLIDTDTLVIVKIPKSATTPDQVLEALSSSLSNLGRSRADLLLLHWPCDVIATGTLQSVWQEMERCLSEGRCQALGVCNFSINALRQLIPLCRVQPSVNQIERHPLLPQVELVQFCASHDILVQAHTALGQGKTELLEHPVLLEIAKGTGLSTAQATLVWNLQHGVAVVPKCTSEDHLAEINGIFHCKALGSKHMKMLDSIKECIRFVAPSFMYNKGTSYSWGDGDAK